MKTTNKKTKNEQFTAPKTQPLNKKSCLGCGKNFTRCRRSNYDYCLDCTINGNRYVQNKCPECGDGSGKIKFPNLPLRACKLCYLNQEARIIHKNFPRKKEVNHA